MLLENIWPVKHGWFEANNIGGGTNFQPIEVYFTQWSFRGNGILLQAVERVDRRVGVSCVRDTKFVMTFTD